MSPCIIQCYKIIPIKNYVRAQDDNFFRIPQIDRNSFKELIDNPKLIENFERLCEGLAFVDSWIDPNITPEMFRIYDRNVPAKKHPIISFIL